MCVCIGFGFFNVLVYIVYVGLCILEECGKIMGVVKVVICF